MTSDVKEQDMPASLPETTELPELASKGTSETGQLAMQGIEQGDKSKLIITDLQNYHDQLQAHKRQMKELDDTEQVAAAEEEIKQVNRQLFEEVQKKHGVKAE